MGKRIFKSFVASCLSLVVGLLISGTLDDFVLPLFNGLDVDYFAVIAISLLVVLNTVVFYITFSEFEEDNK